MALTEKENEFYDLALHKDFISAATVKQYEQELNDEGNAGLLYYALDKFHLKGSTCPNCGEPGVFKWFFLGKFKHPSCGYSWYVEPSEYMKEQLSDALQTGSSFFRDMQEGRKKKRHKDVADQILSYVSDLFFAIVGTIFVTLFRLSFGVLLLPVQALVFHQSQKKPSQIGSPLSEKKPMAFQSRPPEIPPNISEGIQISASTMKKSEWLSMEENLSSYIQAFTGKSTSPQDQQAESRQINGTLPVYEKNISKRPASSIPPPLLQMPPPSSTQQLSAQPKRSEGLRKWIFRVAIVLGLLCMVPTMVSYILKRNTQQADISGIPLQAGQIWIGEYACSQHKYSLKLTIESISATNDVQAIFNFDDHKAIREGKIFLYGQYDPHTRRLDLEPKERTFIATLGMKGVITSDHKFYKGDITSEKCGKFTVSVTENQTPQINQTRLPIVTPTSLPAQPVKTLSGIEKEATVKATPSPIPNIVIQPTPIPTPQSTITSDEREILVALIEDYYSDLNQKDVAAGLDKWIPLPDERKQTLRKWIYESEWYKVYTAKFIDMTANQAFVYVEIEAKNKGQPSERYYGNIELRKISAVWKIASMKDLKKR